MRATLIHYILLVLIAVSSALASESAPKQRELKAYPLPDGMISADISPDERLVAALVSRSGPAGNPANIKITDSIQLWDFRESKLIADKIVREQTRGKKEIRNQSAFTRYSADGKLVICYLDHDLYIFQASDLQEIKRIHMKGPPDETQNIATKSGQLTIAERGEVTALEISPSVESVAVVWARGLSQSWIELIQLDSAKEVVWNTKDRGVGWMSPTSIAWSSDGHMLIVAVPNGSRCGEPGHEPDVFAVEPETGAIRYKFRTGLLLGTIAVTPDARVLAVDNGCIGVFRNHDPKLKIFDLYTGRLVGLIAGRSGGVRHEVSVSRTGDRAVADTGIVKAKFDWLDMVPFGVQVDSTFSVWSLKDRDYDGVVTSQNLMPSHGHGWQRRAPGPLRISPNGGFVIKGANIYELP